MKIQVRRLRKQTNNIITLYFDKTPTYEKVKQKVVEELKLGGVSQEFKLLTKPYERDSKDCELHKHSATKENLLYLQPSQAVRT